MDGVQNYGSKVSFLDYDLGYFDDKGKRVEPIEDPFGLYIKNGV